MHEKAVRGQIRPRAASRHAVARRICDSGDSRELSLPARHDTGERDLDSLVDVVRHVDNRLIERGDHARTEHRAVHPIEKPLPIFRAEQHDGYLLDFMRLNERENLEHLVERAEPSWEHGDTRTVLHEHRLADEEIAEADSEIDVPVDSLFVGQLDTEPDGLTAHVGSTAVDGLHDTGTAAGDDRHAPLRDLRAEGTGRLVRLRVPRRARRAEYRDCGAELGERAEAVDELGLDAEDSPRVLVERRFIAFGNIVNRCNLDMF